MIPSTGSATWDIVLQIALALALLGAVVLMVRNYRDR